MKVDIVDQNFKIDHYLKVTQDVISYSVLLIGIATISLAVSVVAYYYWF